MPGKEGVSNFIWQNEPKKPFRINASVAKSHRNEPKTNRKTAPRSAADLRVNSAVPKTARAPMPSSRFCFRAWGDFGLAKNLEA